MRVILFFLMTVVIFHWASAEEKPSANKSWKTFRSDYGYEFKFPDCWELKINDPDEIGNFEKIKNIAVVEGQKCATSRRSQSAPNSVGFMGEWKIWNHRMKCPRTLIELKNGQNYWLREKNT